MSVLFLLGEPSDMETCGRLCRAGDVAVIRTGLLPGASQAKGKYTLFRLAGPGICTLEGMEGEELGQDALAALMPGLPAFSFRK